MAVSLYGEILVKDKALCYYFQQTQEVEHMTINADTQLYGLIGDPVSKSLSPFIHNYVYEKHQLNLKYMAFRVSDKDLLTGIAGMKVLGMHGFNATIPHKIELLNVVDKLDPYAEQLQAINTVKIKEGRLLGFNTDGPGLIQSLLDHNIDINNARVLVLGAGGAARGIAMALGIRGCSAIGILNRTYEKAEALAQMITLADTPTIGTAESLENDLTKYNVVINTTSVGMYPHTDALPVDLSLLSKLLHFMTSYINLIQRNS